MKTSAEQFVTRDIVVEEFLQHAPEVVWRALNTAELIGRWLVPNDFEPVIWKRFTFQTNPMSDWDGGVHCQVLEVTPNERLVYSWKGGQQRQVWLAGAMGKSW